MIYYRNLPHWHPRGKTLFVAWRLYGSLPRSVRALGEPPEKISPGERFAAQDCILDKAASGPVWLKDARIARCVVEAIRRGEDGLHQYDLHAFVVMPNHVHILPTPGASLDRVTKGIKGVTAREANRMLGRSGQPFWQDESFDHWVRSGTEFRRIHSYIERNPVTAALVKRPEDWPWSGACKTAQAGVPVPQSRHVTSSR